MQSILVIAFNTGNVPQGTAPWPPFPGEHEPAITYVLTIINTMLLLYNHLNHFLRVKILSKYHAFTISYPNKNATHYTAWRYIAIS